MQILEVRFCLRLDSNTSNISCKATLLWVLRRFRLNVTEPSRSSAIKASIPEIKRTNLRLLVLMGFFTIGYAYKWVNPSTISAIVPDYLKKFLDIDRFSVTTYEQG